MVKHTKAKWLQRLLDSNALAVGTWRADGRFTAANSSLLRLTGYTQHEIESGKVRWHQLPPPEYAALVAEALKETQTKGECTPFEMEIMSKDGRRIPVLVGGTTFGDGVTDAGAFFAVNLSERKLGKGAQPDVNPEIRSLSDRQRAICVLLSYGDSEKNIAQALDLGVRTVEFEKQTVAKQLGLPTSKLVVWAVENRPGLLACVHGNHLKPGILADIVGRAGQG